MTRRSMFGILGALPVVAVAAQPDNLGIKVTHSQYQVIDGNNTRTSCGVQVEVKCANVQAEPYIAGYEIKVSWRKDFLGRGNVESVTHVTPPWAPYCSIETGGDESWIQIEVAALIRSGMQSVETVKGRK